MKVARGPIEKSEQWLLVSTLLNYYSALREHQAEIWRSKNSTFTTLVLSAGGLSYLLSSIAHLPGETKIAGISDNELIIKLASITIIPNIFAFFIMELLSAWYEDRFVSLELIRVENKINNLCGRKCVYLDNLWYSQHTGIWSMINPTYARGFAFLLWLFCIYIATLGWATYSTLKLKLNLSIVIMFYKIDLRILLISLNITLFITTIVSGLWGYLKARKVIKEASRAITYYHFE